MGAAADVPVLYRGAETCDLAPEWLDDEPELLALLRSAWEADPDELTPQWVLADWLAERGDPREAWVRAGCRLWEQCRGLVPGTDAPGWDYDRAKHALGLVTGDVPGWRMACVWGCLVAWHAPSGYPGVPMGRTWADERTWAVHRLVWWWSLGFIRNLASAAERLASAAGWLAYAAKRLADAAGSLALAAWRLADAAVGLASAAGWLAYAAVWRFAPAVWGLCVTELPALKGGV